MNFRSYFPCAAFFLISWFAPFAQAADPADFEVYDYDGNNDGTVELLGRLLVPENYDPNQSYPIVLFFHGAGALGDDNVSQLNDNINNLVDNAKSRDFFLYAPQQRSTQGSSWTPTTTDYAMRQVANATRQYNIDPEKIYATGLSLGGGGTWTVASKYGGALAASLPIAGIQGSQMKWENVAGQPVWAFHAVDDGTVGVGNTRSQVNDVRAADGKDPLSFPLNNNPSNPYYNTGAPYYSDGSTFYEEDGLRYTEYSSGGHGIWGRVYEDAETYNWMLSQEASESGPRAGESVLFDFGNRQVSDADGTGRLWNSTGAGQYAYTESLLPFAKTSEGRPTSTILDLDDRFTFHLTNGMDEGGLHDFEIGTDGWVTSDGSVIVIRGLEAGEMYRIEIFASNDNDDGGRGRLSRYQIGDTYIDLEAFGNLTDTAIFEVFADESGWIELLVAASPDGDARYGQINTMELSMVPEPAAVGVLFGLAALGVAGIRRHRWMSRAQ